MLVVYKDEGVVVKVLVSKGFVKWYNVFMFDIFLVFYYIYNWLIIW